VVPELESETATATETASEHPEVVKEEITMRPMTLDEAVTQLDIIEDQFLVFSNVQTSRVNVLYRRNDGMFGLLDPRF